MIKLYGGDKQFSSWSMRAYILLEESKIDYSYKMIGLDWPVKYHENGDIEIITGENDYEIPKEPASGCGCQLTQILKNDSTALIQNSFTKFLPRVPILVDTTNEVVISDILVMEQY
ncbi:glutathione S-transferase, partial [Staphylococcus pseudintermedius]|nr:glutathione S-transferase [Staphylococcus pseudintermedius]